MDVEAGHLVQTVEHHRVLPREDGDRDRTMTEGGVDCIRCLFVLCCNSVEMKKGQRTNQRPSKMKWNRSSGWLIVLFYISALKRGPITMYLH